MGGRGPPQAEAEQKGDDNGSMRTLRLEVVQALADATEAIGEVHALEARLVAAKERAMAAQEKLMHKETLLTSSLHSREEYPLMQRLMSALDVAKRGLESAQSRCVYPRCPAYSQGK